MDDSVDIEDVVHIRYKLVGRIQCITELCRAKKFCVHKLIIYLLINGHDSPYYT